jgi:hypothetical protein
MIGVLCKESEKEVAREFFELFKTPWEFFDEGQSYEVILCTRDNANSELKAKLIIICSSTSIQFDDGRDVSLSKVTSNQLIDVSGIKLPIYGNLARFHCQGTPLIYDQNDSAPVVVEFIEPHGKILRVGYDLFHEIAFLLSEGQPTDKAQIPTLESHIALLREWIIDAGVPVVEVPPIPYGHNFIACLTHDVDFVSIRNHRFDHTMWGFIYRAIIGSLVEYARGRSSWDRVAKNWSAVVSIPLIHMGALEDFWDQFENYAEIEKDHSSTFFMIPFKDKAGELGEGQFSNRRGTHYDISEVRTQVSNLLKQGFEIGLHGIDAWHSEEKGKYELRRIVDATGQKEVGVRMHWLCFDRDSPLILEKAGFNYDSSFGYNETIGFKGGTTQVFQPLGANILLELPLHIQDTALFFPRRMDLNDYQAWDLCQGIMNTVVRFGGVITILWHLRSLAPERLWGDFYKRLLQELRERGAWFGSASQVVQWFRRRRSVVFEELNLEGKMINLHMKCECYESETPLILRVHNPRKEGSEESKPEQSYVDIPWRGESPVNIPLQ